jgi:hypothetical protein
MAEIELVVGPGDLKINNIPTIMRQGGIRKIATVEETEELLIVNPDVLKKPLMCRI